MSHDTLAYRTLIAIARHRDGLDEHRCHCVLELLGAASAVRAALQRQLSRLELTELKLGALGVLFALAPTPATPADLAAHTGVTRSAMTDVLEQLETRGLIRRERDARDRRLVHVHLTAAGRSTADGALTDYLKNVGRIATDIDPQAAQHLLALCSRLCKGGERLSAENRTGELPA